MQGFEFWEVSHAASRLTNYACEVGARYIKDDSLRVQFTQEFSYASQIVVEGVRNGSLSSEQALFSLRREHGELYAQVAEYIKLVAGFSAGFLQVGTGLAVCKLSFGVGCVVGGIPLILHGVNNVYENGRNLISRGNDTVGLVRRGYQKLAEITGGRASHGNVAYGVTDIGLSAFGLARMVLKPGSWRLFRYIEADKARAYREMSKGAIMFEVGVDMLRGEQVLVEWDK
ncbi:DUF4225 domain-containing protein [Pseudomonas entomophila]|uniref:DUF4225 domain-containing protein n=1 Tax=Pseudomonas entomophila TaxID=312306 RepID=UPI0023D7E872|nr:DUF4225 domain-containing protein [Pseudomonas entomophila]MDF0730746.1 DUF4225 domain-containing protein [Pseudomonas entomophila]